MNKPLSGAVIATLLLALGCGAGTGTSTPDAPGPSPAAGHTDADHAGVVHSGADHAGMHPSASEHDHGLQPAAGPGFTVEDVHFMQMMIGHHDQAVQMAALGPERGAGDEVLTLSRRIDISQRDEIAMMQRWLRDRGQVVPSDEDIRSMTMPGLLTEEQFARLAAARGEEFDRLFLNFMIHHHVGALRMVEELFASPGALQDSELFQFATDVGADQLDEIGIMERILEQLNTP